MHGFRLFQVYAEAALVAVKRQELGALPVPEGGPRTGLVTMLRLLDLDHVSAHVAEHHSAEGAGQGSSQVDYLDIAQRHRHKNIRISLG